MVVEYQMFSFLLAHRACAAFFAISFRLFGESFSALALPPCKPPKRPRATAAGFFSLSGSFGGACPVASCMIENASEFKSLGFFAMPRV